MRDCLSQVHDEIVQLSKLGNEGRCPQNIERDFHRRFGAELFFTFRIEPYLIPLPLIDARTPGFSMEMFPFLAPHEVAAALFEQGEDKFREFCVKNNDDMQLADFWAGLTEEDWFKSHPILQTTPDLNKVIPICLHADEAEYLDDQSLYIISWHCPLLFGHSPRHRFLVTTLPTRRLLSRDAQQVTLQQALSFIGWSINQMQLGVWPSDLCGDTSEIDRVAYRRARDGCKLADGYVWAWMGTTGDLKFDQHAYHWDRGYNFNQCCHECKASSEDGPMAYCNMTSTSGWLATVGQYANCTTKLKDIMGFHVALAHRDLMHIFYVEGICNDFAGSMLMMLAGGVTATRATLEGNLTRLYDEFRSWCQRHRLACSHDGFTLASLHFPTAHSFPYLGGKAADCRLVISWLADTQRSNVSRTLGSCALALARFTHLVRSSPALITPAVRAEASECGFRFLALYVQLAGQAILDGQTLYKIRPKMHYFWHICDRMRRSSLNPKLFSCWAAEDYVGKIAKLAERTHRRSTAERTLQRYLFMLRRELLIPPCD